MVRVYCAYWEYTAHIESILVQYSQYKQYQRTKCCQYLHHQRCRPLKYLGSTWSIQSIEPRNAASPAVSAVLNLDILRVLAVSAVHKQTRNTASTPSTCSIFSRKYFIYSQVLGASVKFVFFWWSFVINDFSSMILCDFFRFRVILCACVRFCLSLFRFWVILRDFMWLWVIFFGFVGTFVIFRAISFDILYQVLIMSLVLFKAVLMRFCKRLSERVISFAFVWFCVISFDFMSFWVILFGFLTMLCDISSDFARYFVIIYDFVLFKFLQWFRSDFVWFCVICVPWCDFVWYCSDFEWFRLVLCGFGLFCCDILGYFEQHFVILCDFEFDFIWICVLLCVFFLVRWDCVILNV